MRYRKPTQWQDCITVIRNSGRADCGHPAGTELFRFRVDTQLGETYSLCGHCAQIAEHRGVTVYKYRAGEDQRPYALKRLEL